MHMNQNITFLSNSVPRSPYKFTENMLAENTILHLKKSQKTLNCHRKIACNVSPL